VDDAVAVVRWLLETPTVSGIFNVGTGKASFGDLMPAVFTALGKPPNIEYVDMPETIRDT
jgi:ADP-L-glycero-D-manno-heptose 6-epimerase